MSQMSRKNKAKRPQSKYIIPQRRKESSLMLSRSVPTLPFVDAPDLLVTVSTTVQTLKLFNALQQILTAFPQHATPTVTNLAGTNTPGLRTRIRIHHIDVDLTVVGAQSTTLLSGDLYNTLRYAYVVDGKPYDGSGFTVPSAYLTSIVGGTNITDVIRVPRDEKISLSSTAYDSANGYNVPRVVNKAFRLPIDRSFVFYSTNPTYTSWSTENCSIFLDIVSDSSVTPHPTFSHNSRIFFTFEN